MSRRRHLTLYPISHRHSRAHNSLQAPTEKAYRLAYLHWLHPLRYALHRIAPKIRTSRKMGLAQAHTIMELPALLCINLHQNALREWMGIEPTKRHVSNASTALKAADESSQLVEPQALTKSSESDFTKNDTIDPGSGVNLDEQLADILRLLEILSDTERAKVLGFVQGLVTRTD